MEEQVLVERVVSAINLCNGRQAQHLFKWHHAYLPWALYIYILSNGWTMALALLVLFHIIPNIVEPLAKEWNTLDKETTKKGDHKYSKVNNLSH